MLREMDLIKFVEELASNSPAPGGGSAAALSASLSSALCSMVFNLSIGKKSYNNLEEDKKQLIQDGLIETAALKNEFLETIDKDADEFLELMKAFKLPKDTEEEKIKRNEEINKGYEKALKVPYELAQKAFNVYELIYNASAYGNKNAISDAGVSALLLQTAIEAAVLNVKINLSSIENEQGKEEIRLKCDNLVMDGRKKRDAILEIVNSKIE